MPGIGGNVEDSAGANAGPRRFALVWHVPAANELAPHWDLLLEQGAVLWSWRLPQLPHGSTSVSAERTPDHRLLYLDYSGPLTGDRGIVERRDGGELEVHAWSEQEIRGRLHGRDLHGEFHLVRCDSYNRWSFAIRPNRSSESVSNS